MIAFAADKSEVAVIAGAIIAALYGAARAKNSNDRRVKGES